MNDTPLDRDTAVLEIEALLGRNRFAHARERLALALAAYPADPDLLYFAGWLDWRQDRSEDAHRTARDLLEIEPNSFRAMRLMADIQVDLEDFAEAERLLIAIIRERPADADTIAAYAQLMLATLHVDKAERLAREALRLDPDNPDAQRAMLLASLINGRDEARDGTLASMLRDRPDTIGTATSLVQVLLAQGRTRAAERVAREIVAVQPDDPHLVAMARALRLRNHWTMLPLWPFVRFGWAGSITLWVIAVVFFTLAPSGPVTTGLLVALLTYVVYSWVWPPLLSRWLER